MTDNLERRIRSLPWRKPSPELRDRIFGNASDYDVAVERTSNDSRSSPPLGDGRKVTLHVAIASAIAAAFLGFVAGAQLPTNQPTAKVVASTGDLQADIRIVETSSSRNSFDFSADSTQILPGDFIASLDASKETIE